MLSQKTLNKSLEIKGIGLHSGKEVTLRILPAEPNTGIQFKRTDLQDDNVVIPSVFNVSSANFCTTISNDAGVKISTIEHLMAALFTLGVDNSIIEIDNLEVPILDGSSKIFINEIKKVGLKDQNVPIKIILIRKKITYTEDEKFISIEPSKTNLFIDFEIKYKTNIIGEQRNLIDVYNSDLTEVMESRTFCLYEDVEKIKKNGLAKGGSLDNAIVVRENEILNSEKLRNPKEFVNHKILDCIGDLYTSGYRIIASINCSQGGHFLTNQLLKKVFENKENFSIIEIQERNLPHTIINRELLRSIA